MGDALIALANKVVHVKPHLRKQGRKVVPVAGHVRVIDAKEFLADFRDNMRDTLIGKGFKEAVDSYVGSGSIGVNEALRSGKLVSQMGERQAEVVRALDQLVTEHSMKARTRLWRGGGRSDPRRELGETFLDPGFVSTSADPDLGTTLGEYGGPGYEITVPEGQHFAYGTFGEREVILPRGTTFEVTGVKRGGAWGGGDMYQVRVKPETTGPDYFREGDLDIEVDEGEAPDGGMSVHAVLPGEGESARAKLAALQEEPGSQRYYVMNVWVNDEELRGRGVATQLALAFHRRFPARVLMHGEFDSREGAMWAEHMVATYPEWNMFRPGHRGVIRPWSPTPTYVGPEWE